MRKEERKEERKTRGDKEGKSCPFVVAICTLCVTLCHVSLFVALNGIVVFIERCIPVLVPVFAWTTLIIALT